MTFYVAQNVSDYVAGIKDKYTGPKRRVLEEIRITSENIVTLVKQENGIRDRARNRLNIGLKDALDEAFDDITWDLLPGDMNEQIDKLKILWSLL